MRVVFFVAEYHRLHGGQRSLFQLVKSLQPAGIDPLVVFPGEGECSDFFASNRIPVQVLRAPEQLNVFGQHLIHISAFKKAFLGLRYVLPYSYRLSNLVKDTEAALLHCNTPRSLLLAAPVARLRRLPVIWHLRGELGIFGAGQRALLARLASRIILVSSSLTGSIDPKYRNKCVTIPNAIDETSIHSSGPITVVPQAPPGRFVVATFAAVRPHKGYHYLIEAARLINEQLGEQAPVFLGIGDLSDQPYVNYLMNLKDRYKLENFQLLGRQSNPFGFYQRADLVVLASVDREVLHYNSGPVDVRSNEGLPRTILEGMYFQKPVVATRVAGVPEQIIDGETGFIVPPRDAESLARAILRVLALSAEQRQVMGANGRRRLEEFFSIDQMVNKTVGLFRDLVR